MSACIPVDSETAPSVVVVYDDLWVCFDCFFFHANGELPVDYPGAEDWHWSDGDHPLVTSIAAEWPDPPGHWVAQDSEEEEDCAYEEFSRCDCDSCGSRLAGSRYRMAILS